MNDEIMVRLGLNSSAFQEGMKSATRTTEGFQAKLMGPLNAVKGFGAALGGAFALNTLQNITDHAEKLRNLAEGLNVSTTELQKWQNAMEFAGVSGETSTKALTKFTSKLSSAASGSGDVAEAFANMGIAVQDAGGKARGTMEILGDVADMFATMEDKSQRSRIAVELFGKQGLKMVAALSQGREEMERTGNLKHIISPEALESLDKMGDDLKEVYDSLKGRGAEALGIVAPFVSSAIELFRSVFDAGEEFNEKLFIMAQTAPHLWGMLLAPETKEQKIANELEARKKVLDLVASTVKASKEQKEFEQKQFESALARSDEAGKLYLLEGKQRDVAEKIESIREAALTNVAKGKELKELEAKAISIGLEVEKARAAVDQDATKKKIEAYNSLVDKQERLNKLLETEQALRAAVNAILDKATKVGVEDIAKRTITDATSAEERDAILKAQAVTKAKTEREAEQKAQQEGTAPLDPDKLKKMFDEEMKLRAALPQKFFKAEDIKPQGDVFEKLQEANEDLMRERWQQAQDAINQAEKAQGKSLSKFQAGTILQQFGVKASAEDLKAFPVSNAPIPLVDEEKTINELLRRSSMDKSLSIEERTKFGAALIPFSGSPNAIREFEEVLRASMNPKESETLSKLDEIHAALTSPLKVKPVNGP